MVKHVASSQIVYPEYEGGNCVKLYCACGWESFLAAHDRVGELVKLWYGHVISSRPDEASASETGKDLRGIALRLHEEIREAGEKIRDRLISLNHVPSQESDLGQLVDALIDVSRAYQAEMARITSTVKEVWPNPPEEYDACDVIRDIVRSVNAVEQQNRDKLRIFVQLQDVLVAAGYPRWAYSDLPMQVKIITREGNDNRAIVNRYEEKIVALRKVLDL